MESPDLVDALDEAVAPALELLAHLLHRRLVSAQGLNARYLGEAGGAGVDVRHEPAKILRQFAIHHAVAQAPPGHSVGLGETIEHDGAIPDRFNGHGREVL